MLGVTVGLIIYFLFVYIDYLDKRNQKAFKLNLKLFKKYLAEYSYIKVYFAIFILLSQAGFQYLMYEFFEDTEPEAPALTFTACFCGFFYYKLKELFVLNRKLISIIRLSAANDNKYFAKLSLSDPDNYLAQRDIAYSLILKNEKYTLGFPRYREEINIYNGIENGDIGKPELYELAQSVNGKHIVNYDVSHEYTYLDLTCLDRIMLEVIPKKIKERFKREIYFLRLNVLSDFFPYAVENKIFYYDKPENDFSIIDNFYIFVLNKFYTHPTHWKIRPLNEYKEREASFSFDEFEKFLEQNR